MARSAALNPASMPFFPGGIRATEEGGSGLGPGHQIPTRDQDRSSMSSSSFSVSPSDYRSVRSSPSPPRDEQGGSLSDFGGNRHSPVPIDIIRRSPSIRQLDPGRPYPGIESRVREGSVLESLPEGEDTPGPFPTNGHQAAPSPFSSMQQEARGQTYTPPLPINHSNSSQGGAGQVYTSASPVSSLDSASQFAGSDHYSLDSKLRASPLIRGILERLQRCEYATTAIQRDLSDVNRKVSLLVERSLGMSAQPEFKDPFAPASNGPFSPSLGAPRPSIGNIAPNQSPPGDDITSISQRLNTLTTSVGQLLALQTQQIQSATLTNDRILGSSTLSPPDIAPNHILPSSNVLGHGLPTRPDMRPSPRAPSLPMRTWSAGNLDLPPMRASEANILRPDAILRDKRRSVSGLLRRESSGVLDLSADNFASGSQRDSGPQITKWDQLALTPELLRSLSKFGVGPPNKIQQRALPFLLKGADIIAQAPPTQERIAAYVIPAIQIAVVNTAIRPSNRGPLVVMVSTTVDQATQAQRMIRDLGGPIGVRSALGVGATSANSDLTQELRLLQQSMPHIICGTPQKLHALFTAPGGLVGSEVRFLVLDEVDQLIARNLHEFVFNIVKLLPPPRSRPLSTSTPGSATPTIQQQPSISSSFDATSPSIGSPFQPQGRRFSLAPSPNPGEQPSTTPQPIERQTALFSNTVPQDVLNLATAIQLREPVRVLVRRDGNVSQSESSQGSRGLRQYYLYLAFTAGGGRVDPNSTAPGGGLGIIGSGRGASSAETAQAREWKLDALADLLDDIDVPQAIVHVGGMNALDSVVFKLASRGLEAVPLHGDMNAGTKLAALNKFRNSSSIVMRQPTTKVLVVYDVQVKAPEVSQIPLVVNYDLPKAVEEYAHRVAPAIANNYARAGVVINFVTATGGDVEMLRSIECFYKLSGCRDPDYVDPNIKFTIQVMVVAILLNNIPFIFRPIIGPLLSPMSRAIKRTKRHLEPLVIQRMKDDADLGADRKDRPNDLITWLLDADVPEFEKNATAYVKRILMVNFAAVHSSANTFTQALLQLAGRPEYIEPLRTEVESVIGQEGWSKATMGKLHKLDSFIRECIRWEGLSSLAMIRVVRKPEGFTFSDGTHLPQGTFVACPAWDIHHSEDNHVKASEFNGFRFFDMRQSDDESPHHQFASARRLGVRICYPV
ncbi:hypothetical protein ONZ45_g9316 [Pleurotus djamor]|nr:hypothetical protein ONZ45_g9316 [Pleurotus djamor]